MNERGGVNVRLLLPGALALGVLGYALLSSVEPSSGGHPAAEATYARRAGVLEAAQLTLPAARLLDTYPADTLAEGAISGDTTDWLEVMRRRHDVSQVPLDPHRGGAVRVLLDLADRQAGALDRAGFDGVQAVWASDPPGNAIPARRPPAARADPHVTSEPGAPPNVIHVDHERRHASGGGRGGYLVDASATWIAHVRVYVIPRMAVTLFVRNQYDTDSQIITSEWSYADRSIHGTKRSTGSHLVGREPGAHELREWITDKP
ncbi:MAG: hypothetical protein AB7T63_02340 [Planctomycetota bacterium]